MTKNHITKEALEDLVEQFYSISRLAEEFDTSKTNIRYWLRKFSLNTKPSAISNCVTCSNPLTGKQIKFCSKKCYTKRPTDNKGTYSHQKLRGTERKIKLVKLLGGECSECGYKKNYAALQFHHLDPQNKAFPLDIRKCSNTKWDSLLQEASKCELLCANCHLEEHHPSCSVT